MIHGRDGGFPQPIDAFTRGKSSKIGAHLFSQHNGKVLGRETVSLLWLNSVPLLLFNLGTGGGGGCLCVQVHYTLTKEQAIQCGREATFWYPTGVPRWKTSLSATLIHFNTGETLIGTGRGVFSGGLKGTPSSPGKRDGIETTDPISVKMNQQFIPVDPLLGKFHCRSNKPRGHLPLLPGFHPPVFSNGTAQFLHSQTPPIRHQSLHLSFCRNLYHLPGFFFYYSS